MPTLPERRSSGEPAHAGTVIATESGFAIAFPTLSCRAA